MGEAVKLTKTERSLLDIVARADDEEPYGYVPDSNRAHPKHKPTLLALRARGLLTFSLSQPRIHTTPAGRAALSKDQA